jgi:hypothetical protein
MTKDAYKLAFEEASADLAHAVEERDKWTLEIARLEQLVNSLSAMQKHDVRGSIGRYADEVGFQELVVTCIRQSPEGMSAVDVRDTFKNIGYDLSKFQNPLAVIHGALKRLVKTGKIDEIGNGNYRRKPMPFYGQSY